MCNLINCSGVVWLGSPAAIALSMLIKQFVSLLHTIGYKYKIKTHGSELRGQVK